MVMWRAKKKNPGTDEEGSEEGGELVGATAAAAAALQERATAAEWKLHFCGAPTLVQFAHL